MDYKIRPSFTKAIEDRAVTGIFCVHGNVDDGGDRTNPGALADVAIKGRDRVRFLWNHGGGWLDQGQSPPTAVIKSIAEITRDDLPPAVLEYAPDATGGAEVTREYLDTDRGNEILAGIKAGAIDEMSYAYDLVEWSFKKLDDDRRIREIMKMHLFDISDVNWGMNPATLGKKAMAFVDHYAMVHAAMADFIERAADVKRLRDLDGRSLSTAHLDRLKSLSALLAESAQTLAALVEPLTPPPPVDLHATLRLKAQHHALNLRLLELGA